MQCYYNYKTVYKQTEDTYSSKRHRANTQLVYMYIIIVCAYQEGLIEFEITGELSHELVHAVQPLQEHWAALVDVL